MNLHVVIIFVMNQCGLESYGSVFSGMSLYRGNLHVADYMCFFLAYRKNNTYSYKSNLSKIFKNSYNGTRKKKSVIDRNREKKLYEDSMDWWREPYCILSRDSRGNPLCRSSDWFLEQGTAPDQHRLSDYVVGSWIRTPIIIHPYTYQEEVMQRHKFLHDLFCSYISLREFPALSQ